MAFRLPTVKAVAKFCSSSGKANPIFKQSLVLGREINSRSVYSALSYKQSRGIFWKDGEKKPETESETTQEEAVQKEENTSKPAQKKNDGREETFDVLLEDCTPENKKKLHSLWLKLEKEAADKGTELTKAKNLVSTLEGATNDSKQKIEDLRSRLKEEIEERELMRKRYEKEIDQTKVFSITKFAQDIIEVPDNLERALEATKHLEGQNDGLYEGVKSTHSILMKVLRKHGVVQINPLGEKFDPNFHEALFDYPDPKAEPGTCGVIANTGYLINERVLRPAKVGVVKPPEKIEDHHEEKA